MSYKEKMQNINKKIAEAESKGSVPKSLYIEQIKILESAHDEFINQAKEKGYDLATNLDILEIEIKQYSAMKQIALKIGTSVKEYDKKIKDARIRVYGKDATNEIFYNSNN